MKGPSSRLLTVKVQTRSRQPGVVPTGPDAYTVRVVAPPSRGEANAEVLARLARFFDLPVSRVRIVRGESSSQKRVSLEVMGRD